MNSDIENGIHAEATNALKVTTEQAGIAWATDAIRDALSKQTPEECKFYLDSLRIMAMQLLANEVFNSGLGVGGLQNYTGPNQLYWNKKNYDKSLTNISRSIVSRVSQLIKMQQSGELSMVTARSPQQLTLINENESKN